MNILVSYTHQNNLLLLLPFSTHYINMEEDDSKHLYEVEREMQEYESEGKDDFPHRPMTSLQIHDTVSNAGKYSLYILLGIQVVIILILIILLGINGVTLTHLNTVEVCDNSVGGSTGASTGSLTSGSDCSAWASEAAMNNTILQSQVSEVRDMLRNQVKTIINTTADTARKIDTLGSTADDQMTYIQNLTDNLFQVMQVTGSSAQQLVNIIRSLSSMSRTTISTSSVINDIQQVVNQLLDLQNASSLFNSILPVSCKDIKAVLPNSPTGYYHVNSGPIYCNMDTLCNVTGGWTRLAYLDMTDATQNCPSSLRYYNTGGVRACGRATSTTSSCTSVNFPTNGITYSRICGRVIGYQYASADAFNGGPNHNNLNSYYVDGVSITRGSPRQHVWTFAAGVYENRVHNSNCPCSTGTTSTPPSFVGSNYFCESGNPNNQWAHTLYSIDKLWDGQSCSALEASCCMAPGLPWFSADYGSSSFTDSIELRICGDSSTVDEDTPLSMYEIYVM